MFDWKIKAKSDLHQTDPIVKLLHHHRFDHYHHRRIHPLIAHAQVIGEVEWESILLCGKSLRNTILSTRIAFFQHLIRMVLFICLFIYIYFYVVYLRCAKIQWNWTTHLTRSSQTIIVYHTAHITNSALKLFGPIAPALSLSCSFCWNEIIIFFLAKYKQTQTCIIYILGNQTVRVHSSGQTKKIGWILMTFF